MAIELLPVQPNIPAAPNKLLLPGHGTISNHQMESIYASSSTSEAFVPLNPQINMVNTLALSVVTHIMVQEIAP